MRISCFKKTDEDWYGNYKIEKDLRHKDIKYVEVKFLKIPGSKEFRVCVWGNDDFGMELDSEDEVYIKQVYLDLCFQPTIRKSYLEKKGFIHA